MTRAHASFIIITISHRETDALVHLHVDVAEAWFIAVFLEVD